eukprot:gene5696-6884_t
MMFRSRLSPPKTLMFRSKSRLLSLGPGPNRSVKCKAQEDVPRIAPKVIVQSPKKRFGYQMPEAQRDELSWIRNAIIYQVFPDRFAPNPAGPMPGFHLEPWGAEPNLRGLQGGHLLGVVDKLDHLEELGVNVLYLCPIFTSSANHRYHTNDYFQVDPLLGGEKAFQELLDAAHARGMKVVLDGVFNHTGRGHQAFVSLLENGAQSPFRDWYVLKGDFPIEPGYMGRQPNFDCWWNIPELPRLNFESQGVREHVLKCATHWIEMGVDGWRLDYPIEVPQ